MISNKFILLFVLEFIFVFSVFSKNPPIDNLTPIANPPVFNGIYQNINNKLSSILGLGYNATDFFIIDYNGKNSLTISYYTENGKQCISYKSKLKGNCLEVMLEKKRHIFPPLYIHYLTHKIYLGSTDTTDLAIHYYYNNFGMIPVFAAGGKEEEDCFFNKYETNQEGNITPVIINNKWGFIDYLENIVVEPKYEFVRVFEYEVSRVKLNGKWGLINKEGKEIVPAIYDNIYAFGKDSLAMVLIDDFTKYINTSGEEVINIKENENQLFRFSENGKFGYASKKVLLYPPIFEEADEYFNNVIYTTESKEDIPENPDYKHTVRYRDLKYISDTNRYAFVKYNGKSFCADEAGYLYQYKKKKDKTILIENSKITVAELIED
ncbi:MAG: WG repeat-containing protein [Candidatus Symbiothrix sp.]|nr:WG repeat-containing protein [Candidatus Symbiothrix sp.]